jgi:hypothetical protein
MYVRSSIKRFSFKGDYYIQYDTIYSYDVRDHEIQIPKVKMSLFDGQHQSPSDIDYSILYVFLIF